MRCILKLLAVLCLTLAVQVSYEVAMTIHSYPSELNDGKFDLPQTITLAAAEDQFHRLNRVSRWIVADLLRMPIGSGASHV